MNRPIRGIDYSFGRPNLDTVKAQGYKFVLRYLTGADKALTRPELDELHKRALAVGVVFESTAGRAAQGRSAGLIDAKTADAAVRALGLNGIPIYFAVDFDADPRHVESYFSGTAEVVGLKRNGVYGSERVVRTLRERGYCSWGWQTVAWSAGKVFADAHILQHAPSIKVGGADVDVNDASPAALSSMWRGHAPGPSKRWLRARLAIRRRQLERVGGRARRVAKRQRYLKGRIAVLEKRLHPLRHAQGGKP